MEVDYPPCSYITDMGKPAKYATVEEYMEQCTHPLKEVVEQLRRIMGDVDPDIGEQVKWNSPAFLFNGEMAPFDPKEYRRDIAVVNLNKKDKVLLVFPSGNRIPVSPVLQDENLTDGRKLVGFTGIPDLIEKKAALENLLRYWLAGARS